MRLEDAEETDDDDEERGAEEETDELACPFCGDEFDGVGLCLHIDDEHQVETKAGVISSQTFVERCASSNTYLRFLGASSSKI
jgi:hypothetical protein